MICKPNFFQQVIVNGFLCIYLAHLAECSNCNCVQCVLNWLAQRVGRPSNGNHANHSNFTFWNIPLSEDRYVEDRNLPLFSPADVLNGIEMKTNFDFPFIIVSCEWRRMLRAVIPSHGSYRKCAKHVYSIVATASARGWFMARDALYLSTGAISESEIRRKCKFELNWFLTKAKIEFRWIRLSWRTLEVLKLFKLYNHRWK